MRRRTVLIGSSAALVTFGVASRLFARGSSRSSAARSFRFAVIADPQLGMVELERDTRNFALVADAIEALPVGTRPRFVVIAGDLVNAAGNGEQLRWFEAVKSRFTMPVWLVPGNHDLTSDGRTLEPFLLSGFRRQVGPDRFAFGEGGCVFVGVNSQLWTADALAAQAGGWEPLRGGESEPMRGAESEPARGGESEPARGGESEPARGGVREPLPADEREPLRAGERGRRAGAREPRAALREPLRAAPSEQLRAAATDQLRWLESQLRTAGRQPTFVFQHHPLFVHSPDEPDDYFNTPRAWRARLLALFARSRVRAVFAGHLHREHATRWRDTPLITTASPCRNFDGSAFGYRLVTVAADGSFTESYRGVAGTAPDGPATTGPPSAATPRRGSRARPEGC